MSAIQKVLKTDRFGDLINKVNAIVDYCDGPLTQSIRNLFKLISSFEKTIDQAKTDINDAIATVESMGESVNQVLNIEAISSEEMKMYLKQLYS